MIVLGDKKTPPTVTGKNNFWLYSLSPNLHPSVMKLPPPFQIKFLVSPTLCVSFIQLVLIQAGN